MKNVVVGSQWGDEGKGKIVDCFLVKRMLLLDFKEAIMLVTLVIDKKIFKLSLPSGIVRKGKISILGNGSN